MKLDRKELLLATWMVVLSISSAALIPGFSGSVGEPFVFYGYAPPTIKLVQYGDYSMHYHIGSNPILDIVGITNGTSVEVYDLAGGELIDSFTVNRMELHETTLRNGTYFKVVSSSLVAVLLRDPSGAEGGFYGVSTFYPSTDGTFIGKEFMFMALESSRAASDAYIFFVDGGHAAIYDREGNVVAESQGSANSVKTASLRPYEIYRVVSEGRVLMAVLGDNSFLYLPSLTGGFIGRHFYGVVSGAHDEATSIYVVALEDSEVGVYDMTKPGWLIALEGPIVRKTLAAGESWYNITVPGGTPIRVEGTGDISVLVGRGGGGHGWLAKGAGGLLRGPKAVYGLPLPEYLGDDVKVIGALAGEEIGFYAPAEAVVFPTMDASVVVDGGATTLKKDVPLVLMSGVHLVNADAAVVIQLRGVGLKSESWAGILERSDVAERPWEFVRITRDYSSYASYLLPVQGLGQTYPPPPPIGGVGELIPYAAAGVAVPVAIVAAFIALRRRIRTP